MVNASAWTHKVFFSFVFGFNSPIKPSTIKITPKKSDSYNIGSDFARWYINDDVFPRQKKGVKNDDYRDLETKFYLNNPESIRMDDASGDELDMPF